jgi:hypothetical protein
MLEQHRQDLEGLFLKANSQAVLAQLAGPKVQFEHPETNPPDNLMVFPHGRGPPSWRVYHQRRQSRRGTASRKSFVESQLSGDSRFSGKGLPVHCPDIEGGTN